MNWKELNEQKDYSPYDHGTMTKDRDILLSDSEKFAPKFVPTGEIIDSEVY